MGVSILITGRNRLDPKQKTSRSGRRYVEALVSVFNGSGQWETWTALAQTDVPIANLFRTRRGDRVTLQGSLRIEAVIERGEPVITRKIFVDQVISLRPRGLHPQPKMDAESPSILAAPGADNDRAP